MLTSQIAPSPNGPRHAHFPTTNKPVLPVAMPGDFFSSAPPLYLISEKNPRFADPAQPFPICQNGSMAARKLTDDEIKQALPKLPGWPVEDAKLHREYQFPDFAHAFGFIATAAIGIEKMNHHPEWFNVYNRVRIDLSTHDSGGITQKDLDLAHLLEQIARKLT